jgi:uncharacterized membrane protein YfcA
VILTDPLFYAVAIPAVLCMGLSKGGFSGAGLIATPLVALVIPPLEAAAILLPIVLLQDAITMWVYRRDREAWILKAMVPGAVLGTGLAWLVAAHVSDAFVRLAVGLLALSFVLHGWLGLKPDSVPTRPKASRGFFWGTVSGFTSMLCQAGGPPYQMFVLPQRLEKLKLVGTTSIYFAFMNALKVGPLLSLGQFSNAGFVTSLLLLPLAVATNFFGIWIVRRTPTELFYRIAYALVFVISLALIWRGGMDMLAR